MTAHATQVDKLVDFFQNERQLAYKKGEVIIRPEDEPGGIYYIAQGFVKAYAITKYGEENLLIIRKAGEIFPLLWAFTGQHREIFYEAMDSCTLWRCSPEDLLKFLDDNPDVVWVMLDMAIEMYRIHSERVNNLEYRTVRERVVSFLLFLAQRFGEDTKEGVVIKIPIRRQDIAASINATRETTSRELTALMRKNLINLGEQMCIPDVAKLRALL